MPDSRGPSPKKASYPLPGVWIVLLIFEQRHDGLGMCLIRIDVLRLLGSTDEGVLGIAVLLLEGFNLLGLGHRRCLGWSLSTDLASFLKRLLSLGRCLLSGRGNGWL